LPPFFIVRVVAMEERVIIVCVFTHIDWVVFICKFLNFKLKVVMGNLSLCILN
jgi:hypothetical protein